MATLTTYNYAVDKVQDVIPAIIADLVEVNTEVGEKLPKAGGTMTGALVLAGAPTLALHPATKAYVDSMVGGRQYIGLVSQVGTAAPTAVVLKNVFGTPVPSRTGAGVYRFTLAGAFLADKWFAPSIVILNTTPVLLFATFARISDDILEMTVKDAAGATTELETGGAPLQVLITTFP